MIPFAHPLLNSEFFGSYGGQYVPDLLMPALDELQINLEEALKSQTFRQRLASELKNYAGRPTPLTEASKLSQKYGCKSILLKREDLLHGGAHKLNNVIGQALLAQRSGKTELIAETGAGQHGVATALVGARLGIPVRVFQGAKDIERQAPNADRMRLLGASLEPVHSGAQTLKDAVSEAFRYWMANYQKSYYVIGSAVGPYPYPQMVAHFQSVISEECLTQTTGNDPDVVIACCGGGSNAIGGFLHYLDKSSVKLIGAEAKGGASISSGDVGIFHGMKTLVLQNKEGQISESHSLSAGLDYPAVSPIHSYLKEIKRAEYLPISDGEALEAVRDLMTCEGIIPALESAHAIAAAKKFAKDHPQARVLVILSGRGDKDLAILRAQLL